MIRALVIAPLLVCLAVSAPIDLNRERVGLEAPLGGEALDDGGQRIDQKRSALASALFDRAPRVMAPLVRHGRVVSLVGGLLVVAIGVAMVFDWLAILPRYFNFNTAI